MVVEGSKVLESKKEKARVRKVPKVSARRGS